MNENKSYLSDTKVTLGRCDASDWVDLFEIIHWYTHAWEINSITLDWKYLIVLYIFIIIILVNAHHFVVVFACIVGLGYYIVKCHLCIIYFEISGRHWSLVWLHLLSVRSGVFAQTCRLMLWSVLISVSVHALIGAVRDGRVCL